MDDPTLTTVTRPPGPRGAVRVVLVVACLAYIWGAPFFGQVLGLRHEALRSWRMFSSVGLEVTQARYTQVHADGRSVALDRHVLLGDAKAARFETEKQARATARKLCDELGDGADVRLEFREATRAGWEVTVRPDDNRCARGAGKAPELASEAPK